MSINCDFETKSILNNPNWKKINTVTSLIRQAQKYFPVILLSLINIEEFLQVFNGSKVYINTFVSMRTWSIEVNQILSAQE